MVPSVRVSGGPDVVLDRVLDPALSLPVQELSPATARQPTASTTVSVCTVRRCIPTPLSMVPDRTVSPLLGDHQCPVSNSFVTSDMKATEIMSLYRDGVR